MYMPAAFWEKEPDQSIVSQPEKQNDTNNAVHSLTFPCHLRFAPKGYVPVARKSNELWLSGKIPFDSLQVIHQAWLEKTHSITLEDNPIISLLSNHLYSLDFKFPNLGSVQSFLQSFSDIHQLKIVNPGLLLQTIGIKTPTPGMSAVTAHRLSPCA